MKIYTDGSANNMLNIKLEDKKTSGFGVCEIDDINMKITGFYGFNISSHETSNTGELCGLALGLLHAIRLDQDVDIYADSMYSIKAYHNANSVISITKSSPDNLKLINIMGYIKSTRDTSKINVNWVKGHSRLSLGNEIADYLAGNGRKNDTIELRDMIGFFNRKIKNKEIFRKINDYEISLVKLKTNYFEDFVKRINGIL
jgi:ribonuclease HI